MLRIQILALLLFAVGLRPASGEEGCADNAFAKHDWPAVIAACSRQTRANQSDAHAWYRLGRGYEETRKYSDAQIAFQRAADLKFPSPTTYVHLSANAAAAGDREFALATLESMAANGFAFPRLIEDDERFAQLRQDPRYTAAVRKIDFNGSPCNDPAHPEYRQFDFWVGEWNVFDPAGNEVGASSVQKIINDCVIYENWSGSLGRTGKSFNKYNARERRWEQYWVDEGPTRQYYTGHYEPEQMMYAAEFTNASGQPIQVKLTFFHQPDGSVRQLSESSTDEGKTWTTNYDYLYRRK